MSNQDLDLTDLRTRMADCAIGHTLHFHPRVPSTMPLAHALADTAPSGAIVLADEQTLGRGRLDRRWDAPPGRGLLMSVLLKPPHLPADPAQLPMLAGLAVANGLDLFLKSQSDLSPVGSLGGIGIKWPNDILLTDSELGRPDPHRPEPPPAPSGKKLCGLLIESALAGDVMHHAVLGIGLNVNQTAAELPQLPPNRPQPTSLRLHLGRPAHRADLLEAICRALAELLAAQPKPTPTAIHAAWQARLLTLGQTVTVAATDSPPAAESPPFTGLAVATTLTGDLILRSPTGEERRFSAGDVTTTPGR